MSTPDPLELARERVLEAVKMWPRDRHSALRTIALASRQAEYETAVFARAQSIQRANEAAALRNAEQVASEANYAARVEAGKRSVESRRKAKAVRDGLTLPGKGGNA